MFSENKISGKHMICDIKNITNIELLNNLDKIKELLDFICKTNDFSVLEKVDYLFHPQGLTILYLLSESHISIHTFPEKKYIAFDLYTCREYKDNSTYIAIFEWLKDKFQAEGTYQIVDRRFH